MKRTFLGILLALCMAIPMEAQTPTGVLQQAERVNDWFMQQWPDPTKITFVGNKRRPSSLWTRAVYYEGLMALHAMKPQQRYVDYATTWATFHKWTPRNGVRTKDADDYCCSQTYIDLHRLGVKGATLDHVKANLDTIIARGTASDADWWWIDALQMGMPVFAKMARETGDSRYADKAWRMYEYTRNEQDGGLRNPVNGLWWRDRDFNPPYRTPGGQDCYWSRGDGWVVAALVRVLSEMRTTDAHYGQYLHDLTTMLRALIPLQREDGFWNCSLADATDYGGPEVTGTSLFVYGMAWCVRKGYLPKETFMPVIQKGWQAMASAVHSDGRLGYQQGTGKQPSDSQPTTYDKVPDFDDFGVGCFLLGATEYARLLDEGVTVATCWPPALPEAKAGLRWWWLGSAVDEEGLKYNIDEMASHGIGTLEITPIYGVKGNEARELSFLSPAWMKALAFTEQETGRQGMQTDMNCGTGWPFGGPQVKLDEAACKLVVVDSLMRRKDARRYRDGNSVAQARMVLPAPAKEQKYATFIAQRIYKKGENRRVITLYQSRTRQKVKRAAPGGEGLVIDHFDSTAVAHYLARFDEAFRQTGVPYPTSFFNDSYEVYGADWTPSLLKEFRARRGYDLLDRLELFVDGDTTVISDYRETMGDLLLRNFTEQWVQWCHSHGTTVRNQAHGSPANLIDVYGAVDIPEIEGFGLSDFGIKGLRQDPGMTRKNDSDLSMLKYAPSAAHVMGKPFASSETFTWLTEHFRTSLSQMKPDLDLMFCAGVNHMFFHGAAYSPKGEPWPGYRFYASVDMSPTNTIWRDAPELMRYIERCQSWLQWGQPDNDFLVLLPVRNMWRDNTDKRLMMFDIHSMATKAPQFIRDILTIDSLGYDCDYISEKMLLGTSYRDGQLVTAAGTRYRGLIIPGRETIITDATRQHIDNLRQQGAHIIWDIDAQALGKAARPELMKSRYGLKMIRRVSPDNTGACAGHRHHYFIANLSPEDRDVVVPLAVVAKSGRWFNPMDGTVSPAAFNEKGEVKVTLRSGESRILAVSDRGSTPMDQECGKDCMQKGKACMAKGKACKMMDEGSGTGTFSPVAVTFAPWQLHFIESSPVVTDTFRLERLQTWELLPNDSVKELMGTGVYETTLTLRDKVGAETRYRLDLGDVRESARVYVNGQYVGTAWAVPMTLDFSGILHTGRNTLRIEVTNLPANRIAAYDRRGVQWRKFKEINIVDLNYKKSTYADWAPVPSGLNSALHLYKQ